MSVSIPGSERTWPGGTPNTDWQVTCTLTLSRQSKPYSAKSVAFHHWFFKFFISPFFLWDGPGHCIDAAGVVGSASQVATHHSAHQVEGEDDKDADTRHCHLCNLTIVTPKTQYVFTTVHHSFTARVASSRQNAAPNWEQHMTFTH